MALASTDATALDWRPSRVAVSLLAISVLAVGWLPIPHVLVRVAFAVLAAWGLWHRRPWAYAATLMTGTVWVLVFIPFIPFLLVAPPWVLWFPWLLWLIPTGLVIAACVIMGKKRGKDERMAWRRDWLTRAEAADLIERFVDGRTSKWEWDDFTSIRYGDPVLEKARLDCVAVRDRFPDPHRYCSTEGIDVLRSIAKRLQENPS